VPKRAPALTAGFPCQCDIYGFPTNETAFVGSLTAVTQSPWLEGGAGTDLAAQGISVSCVEGTSK
jgi:hypothetical protein